MTTDAELIKELRGQLKPGGTQPVVYIKGMWTNEEAVIAALDHLDFRARTAAISGQMNPLERLAAAILVRQLDT